MYVGSQGILSEGENIFQERRIMSESGIIFCTLKYNDKDKAFDSKNFELLPYAVLPEEPATKVFFDKLKDDVFALASSTIKEAKTFDAKEMKIVIKKYIAKQVDKNFEKNPVIIVSIC